MAIAQAVSSLVEFKGPQSADKLHTGSQNDTESEKKAVNALNSTSPSPHENKVT